MPSSKKQSLQHISLFKNQQPILRKQGLTHQFQHPCRSSAGSKTAKGAQKNNDSASANEHKGDIGGLLI